MGYNKRYKRLSELTIAELACNKNLDEILDLQDLLKQSIRSHLSRLLFLTDVDEPLECNIKFFRTDSFHKGNVCLQVTSIWQDPIEGIITMNTQNDSFDLDDLVLEDQLYLLECLIEN